MIHIGSYCHYILCCTGVGVINNSCHFVSPKGSVAFPDNSGTLVEVKSDRPAQDCPIIPTNCLRCRQECINTKLHPCNDVCVCLNCGKHLKDNKGACPYCLTSVEDHSPGNLPFPK